MRRKKRQTPKKFTKRMQKKLAILFICIVLALFALNFRLADINMKSGDKYTKQVLSQQRYESKTLPYQRGSITDRNGIMLATSTKVYKLILDAKLMLSDKDVENKKEKFLSTTLTALTNCFGYDGNELREKIESNPESQYIIWDTELTYDEIEEFQNLMNGNFEERPEWFPKELYQISNIKGVWFEEDYVRTYPYNSLACDLIGFSNSENVGSYGIEQQYNQELNGIDGRMYGYLNEDSDLEKVIKPAENGNTIVTTIDMNLQMIAENWIANFMTNTGAENIAVIMMDPNTGEVLAEASAPTFNLNDPSDLASYYTDTELAAMTSEQKMNIRYELWKNFSISTTFEPGSTAKLFTVAAGLEEGNFKDGDIFECDGSLYVGGWTIGCHNTAGDGPLTVEESVMYSCNVAMMKMAQKIGKENFCTYLERFNIGEQTRIDLPGEEPGLVYNVDRVDASTLATNSFGQNYNTTAIQMAAAFCSLVNGGYYYEPHVMKKIMSPSGATVKVNEPVLVKETVSRKTSDLIRRYLYQTVENGTGMKAKLEGYAIGGKTGTAEMQPRDKINYVVSFISCAPIDDPEVVLYVVIDRPHVEKQDNAAYATLLSHDIWSEVVRYMGIFKKQEMPTAEETQAPTETQPQTDENGETIPTEPQTDENRETIPTEPQTDENGETIPTEPQTDENGETPEESTTPVRPTDEVWDEPGFMKESNGESQSTQEESTAPEQETSETTG